MFIIEYGLKGFQLNNQQVQKCAVIDQTKAVLSISIFKVNTNNMVLYSMGAK